jgi:L-malate glycosyltransferase
VKKKICFITAAQKIGGTELSTMRLSKVFVQAGHDVTMIAPGTMMKYELDKNNIPFVQVNIAGRTPIGILNGARLLAKVFKEKQFDIVHCQDVFPVLISYYARKLSDLSMPIIWHERGIHEYAYKLMAKLSYMPSLVIANSYCERNKLILAGYNPDKIRVIYNAIEKPEITRTREEIRSEFGIQQDCFLIGSVGRLVSIKGVMPLLKSFEQFEKQRKNTHLLFIGDGEERKHLEEYVASNGLKNKVTFAGFRGDTANMYNAMDVFAFPSLKEAFGNVAVEAMLCNTVVLASYVGGIPEIITDGNTGFFAPVALKENWIDKMIYLYDNPQIRSDVANRAYEFASSKFSTEKLYKELDELYSKILTK